MILFEKAFGLAVGLVSWLDYQVEVVTYRLNY